MRILLVEANPGLRRLLADELEEAGYPAVGVGTWDEAFLLACETPPALILLNATRRPAEAAQFVKDVRSEPELRHVPIAGIAFVPGTERGIIEAGAQCCIRSVPTRANLIEAARWAASVSREAAA